MFRRLLILCVVGACAGDGRLDPGELELRDVLGVAPEAALTWDADQRAAARHVLEGGMHATAAIAHAPPGKVTDGLATIDATRSKQKQPALGLVRLDGMQLSSRFSTLAPRGGTPIELQLAGWSNELPARGLDVLSQLARDAGHRTGPVVVRPGPQLAVIAAYVPGSPAQLIVNPVLLASLEPGAPVKSPPAILAIDTIGNPYSFYTSVASCANAQRTRCEACLATNSCTGADASCAALAADDGRGYALECINLALQIDTVASCTADRAPACPFDVTPSGLDTNASFLDDATCSSALDQCLDHVFGDHSSSTPPPVQTEPSGTGYSCADAACDGTPSCDDTEGCDGGDASGDSSCDSGDGGGDCSGDDCSSSGNDCSGGGGDDCGGDGGADCSSGGGDCGGGGEDCNAAGQGRHRGGNHEHLWALLPIPFAYIARRRAERRRARNEVKP